MNSIIKRIEIIGLYGYLNIKEEFNRDINLLIGINGSGKTSILNIINWTLRMSIPDLGTLHFKTIILELERSNECITIKCSKTENRLTISLPGVVQSGKKTRYTPLVVSLVNLNIGMRIKGDDDIRDYLKALEPTAKEKPTWEYLLSLNKPFAINLDRLLVIEKENEHKGRGPQFPGNSPMQVVRKLAREEYSKYKNNLITLNAELRNKILSVTFGFYLSEAKQETVQSLPSLDIREVNELEERLNKHLISPSLKSSQPLNESIKNYFAFIKESMFSTDKSSTQAGGPSRSNDIFRGHFRRLIEIAKIFEQHEKNVQECYAPIDKYLTALNNFMADSAKFIKFRDDTNELLYSVMNQKRELISGSRDLIDLSSGEKQILTLLTYLAFTPASLFLIDEPELSLHPKWQDEFLATVNKVMPRNSQLFIATHSPAIVGQLRNKVIQLSPFPSQP